MPELPEAETIVRGLGRSLPGRRIEKVEILHADLLTGGLARFHGPRPLPGHTVSGVGRRGKNVILSADPPNDDEAACLVVNLGMSGRLVHMNPEAPPPSHPGVRFRLDDGSVLVYADVRRFGRLRRLSLRAFRAWSRTLGPEPLARTFTSRGLAEALAPSSSPIRSWLLDQRRVAGVGNIYANEALHRAGLHPRTPARSVPPASVPRLHRSLRAVLRDAIRAQGTTLRDYRTSTGSSGSYAASLRVYGREGAPCPNCRGPVERVVFGGRSAFYCSSCQPENGSCS